jgi:hypothetical protein
VQYEEGKQMQISETVTYFNDMCCLAPATLIDPKILWVSIGNNTVLAEYTLNNVTISAWLYFNDEGMLINFVSDDRYAEMPDGTMKKMRWSTPLKDYRMILGHRIASTAETIYEMSEGAFTYGEFSIVGIEYY